MDIVLQVQGMSCDHCVKAISAAVGPLPGVTSVDVDITAGQVTVGGIADPETIAAAIEDCGYEVSFDASV